jgi:hypothetical protein
LDALLQQAASRGLHINNLFQRQDGSWQCNLRPAGDAGPAQKFALGATAADALARCLAEMPIDKKPVGDIFQ